MASSQLLKKKKSIKLKSIKLEQVTSQKFASNRRKSFHTFHLLTLHFLAEIFYIYSVKFVFRILVFRILFRDFPLYSSLLLRFKKKSLSLSVVTRYTCVSSHQRREISISTCLRNPLPQTHLTTTHNWSPNRLCNP